MLGIRARLAHSVIVMFWIGTGLPGVSLAEGTPPVNIAGSYHLDTRGFTTASLVTSANKLPLDIAFWGFTDFHGDHDNDSLRLTRAFSEYRLSHSGVGDLLSVTGLGVQAELNSFSGRGNDLYRLGLTYKHSISLPWESAADKQGWLQWRAFPYESDNNGAQASLIYFLPISNRVQLKGFADYNVIDQSEDRWVIEPEINVQITDRLSALVELRYNQYEDANPAVRGSGVALGVRYIFTR